MTKKNFSSSRKTLHKQALSLFLGAAVCGICAGFPGGISAQTPAVKASWLGNTFGGGDGKWVQNHVNSFYVAPDGTCYTQSVWDEGHTENAFYKDGDKKGSLQDMGGGLAVTGNGTYIFAGDGKDSSEYVRRFNPDGSRNVFSDGDNKIALPTNTKAYALAASGGELYVSDPNNNRILVYSTTTGAALRNFAFTCPATLAVEPSGNLWIVQSAHSYAGSIPVENPYIAAPQILRYSKTGTKLSQSIAGIGDPANVVVDSSGRLLVADNGPNQQVCAFKNLASTPILDTTFGNGGKFGDQYGTLSGVRGAVAPTKLYNLTGVGTDSSGNLFVCLSGPSPRGDNPLMDTDIRKFSGTSGAMQWRLLGKEFVDIGDADPDNLSNYYSKDSRYNIEYSNDAPGQNWTYSAFTIDPFRYPKDPRVKPPGSAKIRESIENVFMRRIGGKLFMFGNSMAGEQGPLNIWRFDSGTDGEIAIPCGRLAYDDASSPDHPDGEFYWHDDNLNGQFDSGEFVTNPNTEYPYKNAFWPDSQGNIWRTYRDQGIRKVVCSGLDAKGLPSYSFSPRQYWAKPSPFTDVHMLRYIPETDVMYLAGFTTSNPNLGGDEPSGVHTIVRYNNWSTGSRSKVWESAASDYADLNKAASMDVTGNYIFTVAAQDGQKVCVFDASTGARVDTFLPDAALFGQVGWVDIWDGGIRVRQLSANQYVVFVEEDYHNKTIVYRWSPTGDFSGSTPTPTPTPTSTPTSGSGTGLTAQYYGDRALTSLVKTQTDPNVNFDWSAGSPKNLDGTTMSGLGIDNFGIRWTGQVQAQEAGTYTFTTNTDDGVRLTLNGASSPQIDKWID